MIPLQIKHENKVTNTPTKLFLQLNKFFYKANLAHCSIAVQHTKLVTDYICKLTLRLPFKNFDSNKASFNFLAQTEVRDAHLKAICTQIIL